MKKTFLFLILLFFITIILIILSCEYFTLLSQKEWAEKSGREDNVIIYVGGYYTPGAYQVACYWKIIDDNIELIELESDNSTESRSIYAVENTVYSCGVANNQACYWVNSKRYNLESIGNSVAYSIYIKSGIVFTVGDDAGNACYWMDHNKSNLDIRTANQIILNQEGSGKHVTYIGGQDASNDACVWKDGTTIKLPGTTSAKVNSIYLIAATVYSCGYVNGGVSAAFWKNNNLTVLAGHGINSANSVFVSDSDVYIAGQDTNTACYWKNNIFFDLPSSGTSIGQDIFVYNDNVYISGRNSGNFACIWINGKLIELETASNSYAYSIFVVPNHEK